MSEDLRVLVWGCWTQVCVPLCWRFQDRSSCSQRKPPLQPPTLRGCKDPTSSHTLLLCLCTYRPIPWPSCCEQCCSKWVCAFPCDLLMWDFWAILGGGVAASHSRPIFNLWGFSISISTVDSLIFPAVGKGCFLSTSSPSLVVYLFVIMTAKASYSKKPAREKVSSENPGLPFKRRMLRAALCFFPSHAFASNPCTFSKLFTKLMHLLKNFGKHCFC